ncbi:nascent polypeptide-associated complex subunit alpha, muscle-specific form-like [Myotis daubentonii]|uniref:nascent polypeptide-associated complex subunit alpha, muscle-specific form-like n=1 Tax=Myotis daubentonii TaxID=98922 RepID=UPI002872C2E1|nr:nascent polypeptide-associated complex subunit alpha, muscle-specific form-like [Myotis daubentonii]
MLGIYYLLVPPERLLVKENTTRRQRRRAGVRVSPPDAGRESSCRVSPPLPAAPSRPGPLLPTPRHPSGCGGGAAATAGSACGSRTPPALRAASPRGSQCADPPGSAARTPDSGGRAPSGRDTLQAPSSVPSRPPGLNTTRVITPRSPLTPGLAGDHEALEVFQKTMRSFNQFSSAPE